MKIKNDKLAWLITNYLLEFGYVPHENYDGVLDWLNLCTNIKDVDFNIGKYDEEISNFYIAVLRGIMFVSKQKFGRTLILN